jgi:hypothetical protein
MLEHLKYPSLVLRPSGGPRHRKIQASLTPSGASDGRSARANDGPAHTTQPSIRQVWMPAWWSVACPRVMAGRRLQPKGRDVRFWSEWYRPLRTPRRGSTPAGCTVARAYIGKWPYERPREDGPHAQANAGPRTDDASGSDDRRAGVCRRATGHTSGLCGGSGPDGGHAGGCGGRRPLPVVRRSVKLVERVRGSTLPRARFFSYGRGACGRAGTRAAGGAHRGQRTIPAHPLSTQTDRRSRRSSARYRSAGSITCGASSELGVEAALTRG